MCQTDEFEINWILLPPHKLILSSSYVLLLKTKEHDATIILNGVEIPLPIDGVTLLAGVDGRAISALVSRVEYAHVSIELLAKLQVFVDKGLVCDTQKNKLYVDAVRMSVSQQNIATRGALEKWFIKGMLQRDPQHLLLAAVLQKTEIYALVRFLLDNHSTSKLEILEKTYGLSSTHFRRICKKALGGRVKNELMHWRAMKTLLDLLGNDRHYTEVALDHGYDSLSHFSKDIKKIIGIAPSKLL